MTRKTVAAKQTSWTLLAAVLGFLARPCCSIPFFLSLLGLGSSSLGLLLRPYRELFLFTGMIGFAVAAYYTFRVRGAAFNKVFFVVSFLATVIFILRPHL
ncbi:MAG: hypothetical protein HYY49_03475 [Ignavibacteriales bacterium]|nr:hypothetical protein [Ignavibacteriales bacterium]